MAIARKAAEKIGRENYGPDEAILLGPKKMIVGLGLSDVFGLDPEVVAEQQVLNQLGMGFTMAIVSQSRSDEPHDQDNLIASYNHRMLRRDQVMH